MRYTQSVKTRRSGLRLTWPSRRIVIPALASFALPLLVFGTEARLRCDGRSYPQNPTVEAAEPVTRAVKGAVVIEPFATLTEGTLLRETAE
jgi:hypothetical protein